MEQESKDKLASVSSLVTVFENSRYGVEGGGKGRQGGLVASL